MPNTKSAERRVRSTGRRHLHNQSLKTRLKTLEKKFENAVKAGNRAEASTALRTLSSALDKTAKSGVIHANTARRKKSRLGVRAARLAART
jgi:small subunit ribosomal protein S20